MTTPDIPQELADDLAFIQSFCPRFVPCYVEFDARKAKHKKVPALPGWTQITPEQSQGLLATKKFDGHRFFLFLTGDETGLFVIDIDRKNPDRPDHQGKIDGVEAFEMWCGPIDTPDTFTSQSIGGGYHKVYRLTEKLAKCIKNGLAAEDVLCEILHNKRGFMFGEGCKMIHRMLPQPPPEAVSNLIINNYINTQVNIGQVNTTVIQEGALPSEASVNAVLGYDVGWKMTQEGEDTYMLVPEMHPCCVEPQVRHTHKGHSCVYVHRNAVVLNCFSHGKRVLVGEASKRLRALFFQYKGPVKEGVTELVDALLAMASEELLAREKGMVLKRINRVVPVYEALSPYDAFLTARLANNPQLKAFPRRFNDLLVYMARVEDAAFPFVKRDRTYLGFRNGMLNLVSGELEYYGNLPPGVSPRHYIDQVCQFDDLETPLFDRIFRYQLDTGDPAESQAVYTVLLGLIGRLFYAVGEHDSFDVMPFVVGDTNTGKSTLVDIVSAMFAPGSVGVVDSSHETIFGLQAMHDKELIVAPEMPDNMAHQLASDKFKKMVCGEAVAVPIKHAAAETVRWQVPMLMCGNDYPRYRDERGSVSKRLAIFSFTRYVPTQDSSLKHRILTEELSKLVVKCLLAYRRLLEHTGTEGFWTRCPASLKENTSSMHETTDYVHMFLTLGPGDNSWYDRVAGCRKVLYFVQQPGHSLWMEEFKKKFSDYMRFRHPQAKYRWSKDYSAFKRLGYVVERRHMCRACKRPATRACCENYGHANRSHVDVIMNIVCVEELIGLEEVAE
jgi:Family of unknown function (DUF5906)